VVGDSVDFDNHIVEDIVDVLLTGFHIVLDEKLSESTCGILCRCWDAVFTSKEDRCVSKEEVVDVASVLFTFDCVSSVISL